MIWIVFLTLFCGYVESSDWVYRLEPREGALSHTQTPKHWKVQKPGPFQTALWQIKDDKGAHAWVSLSILNGGGTLKGNLQRWLRQMKLEDSLQQDIVNDIFSKSSLKFEQIPILGFDLTQMCRKRDYNPAMATYVIVHQKGSQKIFYKLWGNIDTVRHEQEIFKSWVRTDLNAPASDTWFVEVLS